MTENSSHPDQTPLTTPLRTGDPVISPSDQPPAPRRSRTRTWLIAGGAVLAAAVLAGGGIAVGAAIADETDDDDDRASAAPSRMTTATRQSQADIGSDSAAELSEIIAAAADSAEGDAVGIEARRDGSWDVQFETSTGDETEVHVMADGTTEVVVDGSRGRRRFRSPRAVLDADTVDALVACRPGRGRSARSPSSRSTRTPRRRSTSPSFSRMAASSTWISMPT